MRCLSLVAEFGESFYFCQTVIMSQFAAVHLKLRITLTCWQSEKGETTCLLWTICVLQLLCGSVRFLFFYLEIQLIDHFALLLLFFLWSLGDGKWFWLENVWVCGHRTSSWPSVRFEPPTVSWRERYTRLS